MNNTLSSHLPQDRLQAISRSETLPDRATGSALFADVSGFTALTEKLNRELGARRGAEEISQQLNNVFNALVEQIQKYGGSVINFAGDSMTCWFEGNDASFAIACAFELQIAMSAFPDLALKISIASGPARRMMVGDENIQLLDALGGETLTRMAVGEHLAGRGEILVDEESARVADIHEWRIDTVTGWRFGVVRSAPQVEAKAPAGLADIPVEKIRLWVHPLLRTNETTFAAEFRTVTSMFVRFSGIDYDSESAPVRLNEYVRWAQSIVARYEGFLRAPIIGDKGSYLLIIFGAPIAHEDDSRRALRAALALRKPSFEFITATQIGIATGVVWAGLYGGETRKSYDFIGDEVNLAARLMETAVPGEILVSGRVQSKLADVFEFGMQRLLKVKGKSEEIPVFAVLEEHRRRGIRIQEPAYYLPMAGRQAELQLIHEKLDLTLQGNSQVIGITAEAGLGKSRLAAEAIRAAQRKGFVGYGGACQSDGINTPYLAWKPIWQALFDVDPDMPLEKQIQRLADKVTQYAPNRVDAMPLLSTVLDLHIPDNDFTQNLEPKIRQSALYALFEDCLKSAAKESPLLIVIEDLHWIDALSHDLLEQLTKTLANYPVCFLMAYRPTELKQLESLPQFTKIELRELNNAEAGQILNAKLVQTFGDGASIPTAFAEKLMERSQGNPFYLEELLNYLHDRGLDPRDANALEKIELPDSLHSLILSRIDRLLEREKITLKAASIIGRLFKADWLRGYYPDLGDAVQVKDNLSELAELDITPLDTPEPELAYLFKHIITHEVTYESLPYATRAKLHEQLAAYLEQTYPNALPLEALAFHYEHSSNTVKKIEYLKKAGEAAQGNFANDAALAYYRKLLPLLQDSLSRAQIHLELGTIFELTGNYAESERENRAALASAHDDLSQQSAALFALGKVNRMWTHSEAALDWLAQAKETCTALKDTIGLAQVLIETGNVLWLMGRHDEAVHALQEGLVLARQTGNKFEMAQALNGLGIAAHHESNHTVAQDLYEESLALKHEIGDKVGIAAALNNLASLAYQQGQYPQARALQEESINLKRMIGDKHGLALSLGNLGNAIYVQGDASTAWALQEESLSLRREIGDKRGLAISLVNFGNMAFMQGDLIAARRFDEESLSLFREVGHKYGILNALNNLGTVTLAQDDLPTARAIYEEGLSMSQEMNSKNEIGYFLLGLGETNLRENKPEARKYIIDSLSLRQESDEQWEQTSSLVGVAALALQDNNPLFAAQLLGTVDSALKALKVMMEAEVMYIHKRTLSAVQEQLSAAAFQSAWEEGSAWSLEEAVRKVLKENT
ncbi:MAG: tetratricopeptide repeat protein [Anaerolineales bacterium]|nr:tetratricopeptide repeat protein [Anaerolineales bacterium]